MTADSFSEGDMMGFYNNMIKYLAGFFCRLYRVEVIGAENIPADTVFAEMERLLDAGYRKITATRLVKHIADFGGTVDGVIMRICDILMCLPGFPILLIIGTLLDSMGVPSQLRIYYLMAYLTLFSWPGTARLVRGQILSLREQEYMVAAEAMGYSTSRKIFKHLVPNVMPQLIVSMTLSLGSMILYEASLSYLNMGVRAPYAAWGTMINIVAEDQYILENFFNVWGPPGLCIILAVLGFNFVGDGLRDALDPKMRR